MKIFIYILFGIIFFTGCERIELSKEGNTDKKPLEFKFKMVQCPQCKMELEKLEYSIQVVTQNGKTFFFDDPGCLALWLNENKLDTTTLTIWAYANDSKKYIDAKKAFFSLSDKTPMNYGFGAYENKQDGFIEFEEMVLKMMRGENLTNPKIRKQILGI